MWKLDKKWVPYKMCSTCARKLRKWSRGDKHTFILKTPIVWMEPQNRIDDSYFCCPNIKGFTGKNKSCRI